MRRLTVSSLRREWKHANSTLVPYIRLSGNWLADLGIQPGNRIEVELAGGNMAQPSLVIRKEVEIDL